LKTAARDIPRKARDLIGLEVAAAANYSRGDDKGDKVNAHDFCCCAETLNNPNLRVAGAAPAG
jgi:hypothetical protein